MHVMASVQDYGKSRASRDTSCIIFLGCSPFITLCNGLKMSEYKADWLMGFPLINSLACQKLIIVIFKKAKKQV